MPLLSRINQVEELERLNKLNMLLSKYMPLKGFLILDLNTSGLVYRPILPSQKERESNLQPSPDDDWGDLDDDDNDLFIAASQAVEDDRRQQEDEKANDEVCKIKMKYRSIRRLLILRLLSRSIALWFVGGC